MKQDTLLKYLYQSKYFTGRHLSALLYQKAKAKRPSNNDFNSKRFINIWKKNSLIKPIVVASDTITRFQEQFYRLTFKGAVKAGFEDRSTADLKPQRQLMHEFWKVGICLGLQYHYPNFSFEVDYPDKLHLVGKRQPDAIIRALDIATGKTYTFVLEIEASLRYDQVALKIRKDFEPNYTPDNFAKAGLSKNTQVLVSYTRHIICSPYWTIQHYTQEQRARDQFNQSEREFHQLIAKCKGLDNSKYRFINSANYFRLNEPVWYLPNGKPVKLI